MGTTITEEREKREVENFNKHKDSLNFQGAYCKRHMEFRYKHEQHANNDVFLSYNTMPFHSDWNRDLSDAPPVDGLEWIQIQFALWFTSSPALDAENGKCLWILSKK